MNAASVLVKLLADTSDFERKFGSAASRLTGFGSSMIGAGAALTAGLTVPLVGLGTVAAKTAADFESQMNILSVAARDSGLGMNELSAAALKVGGDTRLVGINATQSADALTGLYKAGLSTSDIFGDLGAYMAGTTELSGALRAAVDLQAASELDLAAASDVVAIAMSTFGLDAANATRISNSFVQTADASVASVAELADSLANVGPTARAFGLSLEDTNLALGLLSERGIRGAEAGTALKSMLVNMSRDTAEVRGAWAELGVALYDAEGNMRALPDVIADLEGALSGLTEEQRNQYVQTLAGTYGMNALNTLLAEGKSGWDSMAGAVTNAASAQEVATARTHGFTGAWEAFRGALETFMIRAATPLLNNFLTPAVQALTRFIDRLNTADPRLVQLGVAFAGVLAAAGPVLLILGSLISTVGRLVGFLGTLKAGLAAGSAALAALGLPVAPVIAVLVALIATVALAVTAWKNNWGSIREHTAQVWAAIQQVIGVAVKTIQPFLDELAATARRVFGEQIPPLVEKFKALWTTLQPIVAVALKAIGLLFMTLAGVVTGVVTGLLRGLGAFIEMLLKVLSAVTEVVSGIIHLFTGLFTVLIGLVTGDGEKVRAGFETMRTGVVAIITGLKDLVVGLFTGLWNTVKGIVSGFVSGVINFFTHLKNTLVGNSIVPDMVSAILGWFTHLAARAGEIFRALLATATQIWTTIRTTITTKAQEIQATVATRLAETAANWSARWGEIRNTLATRWNEMAAVYNAKTAELRTTIATRLAETAANWSARWNEMKTTLAARWGEMSANVTAKAGEIRATITARLAETAAAWAARWSEMRAAAAARLGEILANVSAQVVNMKNAFFAVDWASVGAGIISRVRDGVLAVASSLASAAASVVSAAIAAAKSAFSGAASYTPQVNVPAAGRQGGATYREDFGRPATQNVTINTNSRNVGINTNRTTHRGFIE